jgi:hypothetical protein
MSEICAIVSELPFRPSGMLEVYFRPRGPPDGLEERRTADSNRQDLSRPQALLLFGQVAEIGDFQAYCGEKTPRFANEAERECAKVLDFYGVPWAYEPRSFVLEQDDDGRVTEAFTPDFYLPEQNLFLEITMMKQRLVTRKNRKLRKLRERYPDVQVKLFYKRDIERLAQRYRLDLAS